MVIAEIVRLSQVVVAAAAAVTQMTKCNRVWDIPGLMVIVS